jgi:hypothetical protein
MNPPHRIVIKGHSYLGIPMLYTGGPGKGLPHGYTVVSVGNEGRVVSAFQVTADYGPVK